jgi:hypothetical protein
MYAGDNVWANVARYGLKKDFLQSGYTTTWLYQDHSKWFVYATLVYVGEVDY